MSSAHPDPSDDLESQGGQSLPVEVDMSRPKTRFWSPPWNRETEASRMSQALELIFGLGHSHAQKWPGILVVFRRLETEFEQLLLPDFDIIWNILGQEKPKEARQCWHWCIAVLRSFQSLQSAATISIDHAFRHLTKDLSTALTPSERNHTLLAIYAVLCWTSMTLTAVLRPEQTTIAEMGVGQTTISRADLGLFFHAKGIKLPETSQTSLDSTARRPILKLFSILRGLVEDSVSTRSMSAASDTDTIREASVNFSSLHTIGRVNIKWVADLASHLAFHRPTRTLSVFCLPSFCVSSIQRKPEVQILRQISSEFFPSTYSSDCAAVHREVLLTYRLLFGQSSRSRALATKLLKASSGDVDPFLGCICTGATTRKTLFRRVANPKLPADLFTLAILDVDGLVIESDTYSSRDDFPHFGSRLLIVQQYNEKQQPSRMQDLWRDRRNPLQWYTFWAVLWVGGISIALSVLQLAASVIQAYYSVAGTKV